MCKKRELAVGAKEEQHMQRKAKFGFWVTALLALVTATLVSCSSGDVTQSEYDAVKADLEAAQSEVTALQSQVGGVDTVTVVQAGEMAPAPAGAAPSGWNTEESVRGGLQLVSTHDSSGDPAWDTTAHPLVYITSEGRGYGHRPSETNQLPGVQVIDADTHEVVASVLIDLGGTPTRQPHGLGISPDGQWVYIGGAYDDTDGNRQNVTFVINATTLKLDKVLKQESAFEWGRRSQNLHHITAFTDFEGNERVVLQYGFGANGGPHFILDPNDDNRVVHAITYDDVKPMGHPYISADVTGQFLFISMGANWIRSNHTPSANIAKLDLSDGSVTIITGTGSHPIGTASTSDGKTLYVADGHGSAIYKIDLETNEVVGSTSSAVAGPYGVRLSWDETELYVMGKGEGTHNTGGGVGVIDLRTFRATRSFNQPIVTGGAVIDHGILHPDPEKNELWISSAGTWETIIVDLDTYEVIDRVPSPNGGDTHSGGFVRYNPDFTGQLLADHATPQGEMFATMAEMAAAAAAAAAVR